MKKIAVLLCVFMGSLSAYGQSCTQVGSVNQAADGSLVINGQFGIRNTPANAAQVAAALQDQSLVVCTQGGDVVSVGREANDGTRAKLR